MKNKVLIIALLCILIISSLSSCKKKEEVNVDLSDFQPPANYQWEGNYLDEDGTTTLVIEKINKKKYHCVINVSDEEITHMDTYEFTAVKDDIGLSYENGVHTTFDLPDFESDPDGAVETAEVYTDGTGSINYLNEHLYWMDNKNSAGSDFAFTKIEESDQEE